MVLLLFFTLQMLRCIFPENPTCSNTGTLSSHKPPFTVRKLSKSEFYPLFSIQMQQQRARRSQRRNCKAFIWVPRLCPLLPKVVKYPDQGTLLLLGKRERRKSLSFPLFHQALLQESTVLPFALPQIHHQSLLFLLNKNRKIILFFPRSRILRRVLE